ncbi:MAG: cupin domain-containing protein [Thermoleophilia bacterium]
MSHITRERAGRRVAAPGYDAGFHDLGDGWTVAFEEFTADADPAELFRGLPDDRCQCTHLGYVISGSITLRYPDRVEVVRAGDAYLVTPGHTPRVTAGTRVVEFSPTEALSRTVAVVGANLAAMAEAIR